MNSDDYGDATLTTQGGSIHRAIGVWERKKLKEFQKELNSLQTLKEQGAGGGSAEDEAYQRKLKALQKAVIQFQINYIRKKQTQARAQQAIDEARGRYEFSQQAPAAALNQYANIEAGSI